MVKEYLSIVTVAYRWIDRQTDRNKYLMDRKVSYGIYRLRGLTGLKEDRDPRYIADPIDTEHGHRDKNT